MEEPTKKVKCYIHKYRRIEFAGRLLFACAAPLCSHYMPKHMEGFLLGKASFCWECDKAMVMDEVALGMDKPICVGCRLKKVELPGEIASLIGD